jgi:predicted DNA repair protein MutK
VPPAEIFAGMIFIGSVAMLVVGGSHIVTKLAQLRKERLSSDVERRLARLEVAIDDLTATIGRLLPGEVSNGPK